MMKGVMGQQNSSMTINWVHSTKPIKALYVNDN